MELPREILTEIVDHIRRALPSHRGPLSNSGIQIALTCKWLYEELQPVIEEYQRTILATAMDTTSPEPDAFLPWPVLRFCDMGWTQLSSTDFVQNGAVDSRERFGGPGIGHIMLRLPFLETSGTDVVWSLNSFLSRVPDHVSLRMFQLVLWRTEDDDESGPVNSEARIRWIHAIFSLLNTVISRNSVSLDVDLTLLHKQARSQSAGLDGAPLEDFEESGQNSFPDSDEAEEIDNQYTIPLRPQDLADCPLTPPAYEFWVVLRGPLFDPELYPLTRHIIRRCRDAGLLEFAGCLASSSTWTMSLQKWTFPRLWRLNLGHVNIPIPSLVAFLQRHPNIQQASFKLSHQTEQLVPPIPRGAEPLELPGLRELEGDPYTLKALFRSEVRMPALAELTVDCTKDPKFQRPDMVPEYWDNITTILDRLNGAVGVCTPFSLTLHLPSSPGMNEWLGTINWRQKVLISGPVTAIKSLVSRGSGSPQAKADSRPSLLKALQGLHCVTQLHLKATDDVGAPRYPSTEPRVLVAFISALPAVEEVSIEDLVKGYPPTPEKSAGFRSAITKVWSRSKTLKKLQIKLHGALPFNLQRP